MLFAIQHRLERDTWTEEAKRKKSRWGGRIYIVTSEKNMRLMKSEYAGGLSVMGTMVTMVTKIEQKAELIMVARTRSVVNQRKSSAASYCLAG